MGTRKLKILQQKQQELKKLIKKLFKSQKYFAEQYLIEEYVSYDEDDLKRFYEQFKKEINRTTTSIDIINKYLNFIFDSEEFKRNEYIKPKNYFKDEFSDNFNQKMKNISQLITDELIQNDDSDIDN